MIKPHTISSLKSLLFPQISQLHLGVHVLFCCWALFQPLGYSCLHVSFLTKNSKLVPRRLDSWPCGSPWKVFVGVWVNGSVGGRVCMCTVSAATTLSPHCRPHGRGVGVSWFEVGMAMAVVVGCEPRLTCTTYTEAKSLCDHSNEAESAEHLAKPQQHFTIASPQLCVCVCTREYLHVCMYVCAQTWAECVSVFYNHRWLSCWNRNGGIWKRGNTLQSPYSLGTVW